MPNGGTFEERVSATRARFRSDLGEIERFLRSLTRAERHVPLREVIARASARSPKVARHEAQLLMFADIDDQIAREREAEQTGVRREYEGTIIAAETLQALRDVRTQLAGSRSF